MDAAYERKIKEIEKNMLLDIPPQVKEGKRFRAILTILSCQALKGDPVGSVRHAIHIENIHEGSLAIDDILDMDAIRRNLILLYGNPY